jgi:hypothetical protein
LPLNSVGNRWSRRSCRGTNGALKIQSRDWLVRSYSWREQIRLLGEVMELIKLRAPFGIIGPGPHWKGGKAA